MKKILPLLLLPAMCGCLSTPSLPECSCWLIEYRGGQKTPASPKFGVTRLSQVIVNLPYGGTHVIVLKKDGTVAFDPYNTFAAQPTGLLKGPLVAAMKVSGLFSDVIEPGSSAVGTASVEFVVSRLALDCRQEESRQAVVELLVRVQVGKEIVATATGEGVADATDGDFGTAFSRAVSQAVSSALSKLR